MHDLPVAVPVHGVAQLAVDAAGSQIRFAILLGLAQ
jgi:hypothetical protein